MRSCQSSVRALIAVVLVMLSCGQLRAETVVPVASAEALSAALAKATADTVLQLAGGDYGALVLKDVSGGEGAPIILRAADPAAPVTFTTLDLRGVKHMVLDGLTFDYTFAPEDKPNLRPFQISGGQDVTIQNSLFDGDMAAGVSAEDDGFPTGVGLSLRDMTGVLLQGNEIRDFYRGLVVSDSVDVVVKANDIHGLRMDGGDFAQVENVRIEGNHIHDFKRVLESADHANMIQFWTNGTTKPSRNITIRDNILNSGKGWFTQSIFMRNDLVDRGLAGAEMFYSNVTIENNVIINAHLHGITMGEVAGLVIRNNTVVRNAASQGKEDNPGLWTPQIRVAPTSTKVTIADNVANKVVGYDIQADWAVSGNFLIQDGFPSQPGFYDQVFVAARSGDPTDLASFAYLAGGPLDGVGIGASQLDPASAALPSDTTARPVIRVVADPGFSNRFSFDAGASALPEGVSVAQVAYAWALDDGTRLEGVSVQHTFTQTGPHQVVLTLTMPDASTATARSAITVPGPDVLTFSPESGQFTSYAGRDPMIVPDLSLGEGPAVLGQGVAPIMIPASLIAPFFQADDFELRLRLRGAGNYKSAGELLRIHKTLLVTVTERGVLDIRFDTATAAQMKLKTGPIPLFKAGWQDITLSYSAKTGLFNVLLADKLIAQGRTSGVTRPMEHWGLALGNPFANRKSFDGELAGLSLRVNQEAFAAAN